jgi:hypothetical protein
VKRKSYEAPHDVVFSSLPSIPPSYKTNTQLTKPWIRLLPCNLLTVVQLVRKYPRIHRTWGFFSVFTRARNWSLSWATRIQPTLSHPESSVSLVHLRLGLPIVSSLDTSWPKCCMDFTFRPHMVPVLPTSSVYQPPVCSSHLCPNILLSTLF